MLRVALHGLPFLLLVLGFYFGAGAALLLACVPYIKTKRLTVELGDLRDRSPEDTEQAERLESKRRFWRNLTFLGQEISSP